VPHAIRLHRTGGPEVLALESVAVSEPGPGEALIAHRAIGINYIDTYHRSGLYPLALPSGIGVEAVGVVLRIGPGVSEVSEGERVGYVSGPPGAYAEQRVVPAARLLKIPDAIDDETAAAVLLKGMTVEALIRRVFPVQSGQSVLWHAAAGGVGLLACQWLARLGARVIATVGSQEKAELAREYGANEVIVNSREDFSSRVRELTGGAGVPVVFDSVGKSTFDGSLACLARRGTLVCFGNASGKPAPLEVQRLATQGSVFLTRPVLYDYIATREELLASAQALFELVAEGSLRVRIGQRFALDQAARAHEALEARATTGSSLLLP
jgi:NADPH2:quinone reductase